MKEKQKQLLEELEPYISRSDQIFNKYECSSFLLGVHLPDEYSFQQLPLPPYLKHSEPAHIKSEIKRTLGTYFAIERHLDVDYEDPDITLILDLEEHEIQTQVRSCYIFGRYNKYVRNLPQTPFHCRECRGKGCSSCDETGREYQTSLKEIIEIPFMIQSEARRAIFHGAGREDINVRCFGGRMFILELEEPRLRSIPLESTQEEINHKESRIEVFDLAFTRRNNIRQIKELRADKTYRAIIETKSDVSRDQLRTIDGFSGTIHQQTPTRVNHRRSDKTRDRKIYRTAIEARQSKRQFLYVLTAEAGTYIKEFISGDQKRTEPNVSEMLGKKAVCKQLDVLQIHDQLQDD